jgi:hypothetical protein
MLSGCQSGSALCAICSFCMRLAHSRAGYKQQEDIFDSGQVQRKCYESLLLTSPQVQNQMDAHAVPHLGNRQEGEALHAGEHIGIWDPQGQVVQVINDAQLL